MGGGKLQEELSAAKIKKGTKGEKEAEEGGLKKRKEGFILSTLLKGNTGGRRERGKHLHLAFPKRMGG